MKTIIALSIAAASIGAQAQTLTLTLTPTQRFDYVALGSFAEAAHLPISADGVFSWYVLGSIGGAYPDAFDWQTNVPAGVVGSIDIPADTSNVWLYATGYSTNNPWVGDYTGTVSALTTITVSAVPEPDLAAMMLAGLGALGFMARRRVGGEA